MSHRGRKAALSSLLLSSLSAPELDALLGQHPRADQIQSGLLVGAPTRREYACAAVDALDAAGAIDRSLFQLLRQTLPQRAGEVDRVASRWGVDPPGTYAVVLVHPHRANRRLLRAAVGEMTGRVLRAGFPDDVRLLEGLSREEALRRGRRLEVLGAVVSYPGPPGGAHLCVKRRTRGGLVMVWVPPTTNTKALWMMETPLTRAEVARVSAHVPAGGGELPATGLTVEAARQIARRLSQREGLPLRLPRESEWEGAVQRGREPLVFQARFGCDVLPPVRTREPNALGLYDLLGLVHEWALGDGGAPVLKGGCWRDRASRLRAEARSLPGDDLSATGARFVSDAPDRLAELNGRGGRR